jgi:hypothetical protein
VTFPRTQVYTLPSIEPGSATVETVIERLRDAGKVPLGVLSFDVEKDRVTLDLFWNVDMTEVNALLEKFGLVVNVKR